MADDTAPDKKSESPVDKLVETVFEPKDLLKTLVLILLNVYRASPALFGIIMASVLGVCIVLRTLGLDIFYMIPPLIGQSASFSLPILRDASWIEEVHSDQKCLARGKELGKRYVLRNVIQWIRYSVDNTASGKRHVEERIMYDLVPLSGIAKDDQTFREDYTSSNKSIHHWSGPMREQMIGGNDTYEVLFAVKHGNSIVVTTGAVSRLSSSVAKWESCLQRTSYTELG